LLDLVSIAKPTLVANSKRRSYPPGHSAIRRLGAGSRRHLRRTSAVVQQAARQLKSTGNWQLLLPAASLILVPWLLPRIDLVVRMGLLRIAFHD